MTLGALGEVLMIWLLFNNVNYLPIAAYVNDCNGPYGPIPGIEED